MSGAQRRQILRLVASTHANRPMMMNMKPSFARTPDAVHIDVRAPVPIPSKDRVFFLRGEWLAVVRNLV